ncbi:MAG: ABC transporter ATP-binding protein/permease [Clostridia bacterium]|nr:ABC transporter ATP-binding protein/permease [Clostridia bacterium]
MLRLDKIVKTYDVGDNRVEALRGVSMEFRKSEFVAILGPSGCGKTTLLNIIGGLDSYTSGDLIISDRSTKEYKDSDWDTYRNHSVGFVFQSYNLIPHQTVLANVELALTLSGVSKKERRKRAKEALERVGLGDQLNKKPSQMSGGQMQRVAIARALVNDPEIILADEPTGALDSETSVQIMEILKEISSDKLIIMVTHNPELAEEYSSRIIRLLDGQIVSDTDPYQSEAKKAVEKKDQKKQKKPSMSFFTALSLSFKNLLTKKGRTILTSFAGSIGIIGIALILSVSNGVQIYIDDVQEETLSAYPITIQKENQDISALMGEMMAKQSEKAERKDGYVYSNSTMFEMMNAMSGAGGEIKINDLAGFKEYLDSDDSEMDQYLSAIQYTYDLDFNIYVKDVEGNIANPDIMGLLENLVGTSFSSGITGSQMYQSYAKAFDVWNEMLEGKNGEVISPVMEEQYELIHGKWPAAYNEVVLILNQNNELNDICLYALGLETEERMNQVMIAGLQGKEIEVTDKSWTYEEICKRDFRLVPGAERYEYNEETGTVLDKTKSEIGTNLLYENGLKLKIVGILRPNEGVNQNGAIGYTAALTRHVAKMAVDYPIVQAQLDDPDNDIFTGLPFKKELDTTEKVEEIKVYFNALNEKQKAEMYVNIMAIPEAKWLEEQVAEQMKGLDRAAMDQMLIQMATMSGEMDASTVEGYLKQMDDATVAEQLKNAISTQVSLQYEAQIRKQYANAGAAMLAAQFDAAYPEFTDEQLAQFHDKFMNTAVSESNLEENFRRLGYAELTTPISIQLYASTFEDKDRIAEVIETYNNGKEDSEQIEYTDYVAILMSSVTTVINAISYVLIAFVAISLVVSSIMIGIITYISVLERTKEIGILRAIGASKRDISRVFNAETLIIGFGAGALGILVTLLFVVLINVILNAVTGIPNLNANLPWLAALILIGISMLLTLIAGLIPSRVASKKDPVIALRSE